MKAIFPDHFSHLELLNPNLNTAGKNWAINLVSAILKGHDPPRDEQIIARATLALVDDYASFRMANQDVVHPDSVFFSELERRTRFAHLRYHTPTSGGTRRMQLVQLHQLVAEGSHLDGELPEEEKEVSVWMVESELGFITPAFGVCGHGTMHFGNRKVRYERWGDSQYFSTLAETTYTGDTFRLEKIHSPHYRSVQPSIETTVQRELHGLRFNLDMSGMLTSTTPASVIPVLEAQLRLLDDYKVDNPRLRAQAHQFLGACYLLAGDRDAARQHYDAALQMDPAGRRLSAATAFLRMDDPRRAMQLYGDAIAREGVGIGVQAIVPYLKAMTLAR